MKVLLTMLTAIIIVGGIGGISAETPRMEYTLEFQEAQSRLQLEKESISVATDKPDYQGGPRPTVSGSVGAEPPESTIFKLAQYMAGPLLQVHVLLVHYARLHDARLVLLVRHVD